MLQLLSFLQTHRFWRGSELAERLEISERTLRRDVERLRGLGYQVNASRGVAGGYQLEAGAVLPPLLLDEDEAIAIAVGLRTAAGGVVRGIEETSVRALTKVIRIMAPRLRRRVAALQANTSPARADDGPTIDMDALAVIAGACEDREQLRFDYAARGAEGATRLVEPNQLVIVGRRWYLLAWDIERADWRTFRVDRLTDPRSARYRFEPRAVPGGDAGAFVRERLVTLELRYQVAVRIQAAAPRVERITGGWGTVEEVDDETSILRMSVDSLHWPTMILAGVGADFEIIEPPELRDHVRRNGELFLRASGRPKAGGSKSARSGGPRLSRRLAPPSAPGG